MASLIQRVGRLALRTFGAEQKTGTSNFQSNYEQLCQLLSGLTPAHLNLDPSLLVDRGLYNPSKDGAPVTYMLVYEDADLTICVFILKPGVRLPLHDHPGMHGLLKVVHGIVGVQSYTVLAGDEVAMPGEGSEPSLVQAIKHGAVTVGAQDPACRLCPGDHNLHEIRCLQGPAAFLDVLAPPYGPHRDCHYFKEWEGGQKNGLVWLDRVPTPLDFWCDQAHYRGLPVGPQDPQPADPNDGPQPEHPNHAHNSHT